MCLYPAHIPSSNKMSHLNQQDNYTSKGMSIFHSNIRSIRKNLNQLLAYISQQPQRFDVIAVTETWLKRNENIVIHDYTMLSQPRDSRSRGGGVALFVKNEHSYTILPSLSCSTRAIESLFVIFTYSGRSLSCPKCVFSLLS